MKINKYLILKYADFKFRVRKYLFNSYLNKY